MKKKSNLHMLVITSVLCLLPLVLSFAVYDKLPDQIAIHWNGAGEPDNYASKPMAAFGLPFLFLALNLYSKIRLYNDPKRLNNSHSQTMQMIATWIPPVLSVVLVPVTLFIAMGMNIPVGVIVPALAGVLLIVSGNYLPKCRQNYTIGIKLPWTLNDVDNWNKTHRMAGYLWMLGGTVLLVGTFLFQAGIPWTLLIVIPLVIAPVLYSYSLYRKGI